MIWIQLFMLPIMSFGPMLIWAAMFGNAFDWWSEKSMIEEYVIVLTIWYTYTISKILYMRLKYA